MTLGILDLFLLDTIAKGRASTSYDLRRAVGLSWGGVRPALLKLERLGLLKRSAPGFRRRREFRVTAAGEQAIETQLRAAMDVTAEAETVIRAALLAFEADRSLGLAYLHAVAQERRKNGSWPGERPRDGADLYAFMRAALRDAEAQCFERLMTELKKVR